MQRWCLTPVIAVVELSQGVSCRLTGAVSVRVAPAEVGVAHAGVRQQLVVDLHLGVAERDQCSGLAAVAGQPRRRLHEWSMQACQAAHAAVEFALTFPEIACHCERWQPHGGAGLAGCRVLQPVISAGPRGCGWVSAWRPARPAGAGRY